MNVSEDLIRRIADHKFPGDPKKAEAYIKNFNPSDPACIDDEREFLASAPEVDDKIGQMRQQFRVEDYFIRKLIYDFYTGEVKAFLFPGADNNKEKADALAKGTPEEQKMAEWIRNGFSDRPISLNTEKPLLYEEAMQKFSKKYGVNLDPENVAAAITEIAHDKNHREESYRQYFKCIFASAYCRLDEAKQAHIDAFCKDFNKVMMVLLQEKTGTEDVPAMKGKNFAYGCMDMEELKEYLTSFRESANDLTKQAQLAQTKEKDPFATAEKAVKDILADDKIGKEEKESLGMAQLQAAERRHGERPKFYFLTSPIQNIKEKNAIRRMKNEMVKFTADKSKVEEMERRKTIYRPSFTKEKESIAAFTESAVKEFDLDRILTSDDLDLDNDFLEVIPKTRETVTSIEPVFPDGLPDVEELTASPIFGEDPASELPKAPGSEVPALSVKADDVP